MHAFSEFVNPYLGKLLKNVKMDKSYVRGEGCYLYDAEGNQYLDCVAAYGALPFGYNPPEIWDCINSFQLTREPSFIQPSFLNAAGELAKRLIEAAPAGLTYVTFTNSGAEAVEAAIKLCRSATGRRGILAARNSFHGKTLGALSATGKSSYQTVFGAPVEGFHFIEYGEIEALETEFKNKPDFYAAFLVEPIQGEGGIIVPPDGYLSAARDICSRYGVKLAVDEIQTGLGRTGRLFACEQEKVCPDVLLAAKALGGGILPIGACMSTAEVYNKEFAMKHSSTFAGNSLACRVGIRVLELLEKDECKLLQQVKANGDFLKNGLLLLQKEYPHIIKSVRGRGLMLGIEFGVDLDTFPQSMLGIMGEKQLLSPVISSYLLNVEHLRVAPTLNGDNVIRIEPPLTLTREQCNTALIKIENMLKALNTRNTAHFISYLTGKDAAGHSPEFKPVCSRRVRPSVEEGEGRFAFLVHPLDYKSYYEFDASLSAFSREDLAEFTNFWNETAGPNVISCMNLTSRAGKKAYGEFICILRTAEDFIRMPREQALAEIHEAIGIAKDRGARIVGLGAYTSVVSMGGLYLKECGIPLTTGNSYTVVSAVEAIQYVMKKTAVLPERSTAAVIGAAGSIGRGLSLLLSEQVSQLILIGNPSGRESSLERLCSAAGEIYRFLTEKIRTGQEFKPGSIGYKLSRLPCLPSPYAAPIEFMNFARGMKDPAAPVIVSTAVNEVLPNADIVVSATNSTAKIITRENLKFGAIVCDISRPANVGEEILEARPDILVIDGGVVEVPGLPSLGWNFGFEQGLAYACMAETMMLALEHRYEHTSLGSSGVHLDSILLMRELALQHGFRLAKPRSFNRPFSDEMWERYMEFRRI